MWTAECDSDTVFSSIASAHGGLGFVRAAGTTTVHVRGPASRASTLSCPPDTEYFGVDLRVGAYLPMFAPVRLANLEDEVLPTLDGKVLLGGQAWEMPTAQNVDVFVERLEHAGLVVLDPLVERLQRGDTPPGVSPRTAQSRFVRAVGLPRRTMRIIEQARRAATLLRGGSPIPDVVSAVGYYDQPHLTRSLRALIGHTPTEVAAGRVFLAL